MNWGRMKWFAAAAAVCVLLCALPMVDGVNGLMIIAMPFTAAAHGLRAMSLSGNAGNAAAIILYILISLLPMLLTIKRKWRTEDWLLPVTSATILYALYYCINPGFRPEVLAGDSGTLIYAGAVYSVFLAWWIVKLLRYCDDMGVKHIYRALRILLLICGAGCIWIGFGVGLSGFLGDIAAVKQVNTMPGLDLMPTHIFQFLAFAVTAVEYGAAACAMGFGIGLLKHLEKDPYSESCHLLAEKTARWCKGSILAIVVSWTALNLAQVAAAPWLHSFDIRLRLPVLGIAIVFAMLVLTRLLCQGRKLKEDNDLFI